MVAVLLGPSSYVPATNLGDDDALLEGAMQAANPGDKIVGSPGVTYRFTKHLLSPNTNWELVSQNNTFLWKSPAGGSGDIDDAAPADLADLDMEWYGNLTLARALLTCVESATDVGGAAPAAPRTADSQSIKLRGHLTVEIDAPNDDGGNLKFNTFMDVWGRNPSYFDPATLTAGVFTAGNHPFDDPGTVLHRTLSVAHVDVEDLFVNPVNLDPAGKPLNLAMFIAGGVADTHFVFKPITGTFRFHRCRGLPIFVESSWDATDGLAPWVMHSPTLAVPTTLLQTECDMQLGTTFGFGVASHLLHGDLEIRDNKFLVPAGVGAGVGILAPHSNETRGSFANPDNRLWYPLWEPTAKKYAKLESNTIIVEATGGFFEGMEYNMWDGVATHVITERNNTIKMTDGFAFIATIGASENTEIDGNTFIGKAFAGLDLDGGTGFRTNNNYSNAELDYEVAHENVFAGDNGVSPASDSAHYVSDDNAVLKDGSNNQFISGLK